MTCGRIVLLLVLEFVLVESIVVTRQTEQSRVWEGDRAVQRQRIERECVGKALDLVFIIDSSRSILPRDFEKVKDFIVNILRFLDVGLEKTRVGLVLYGSTVEKIFSLGTHGKVEDMERAVRRMEHLATGTMTGMAIKYTADVAFSGKEGARPQGLNVPRVAVIVTDGRPQDPVAEPAARARDLGILIFAVGVGRVDMATLRLIGSEPHEKHVFFVQNFSMIQTLLSEFHTKICDTDLCGVVGHGCEQICINAPGSFICKCKAGFILNSDQKTCRRIDQCQVGEHGCEHECVSTATSYSCRCRSGFTLKPDGRTCRRIDQCQVVEHGCEHECVSTATSYSCRCRSGFTLNPDGRTCWRTDFCLSARNTCEHECVSTADSYLCRCRKGYILNPDGKSCRQCRSGTMDLVFIIDGSKRLGAQNFQLVKQFVNNIVDGLEVAPNATRVGLVQYSARVRTEFPLRRYSTAKEVKTAVSRTKYTAQGLRSGVAVRQLFKQSFRVVEGARPLSRNIPRVAIMFTDGREQGNMAEWATKAKQNGINIYAVGIGETIEEGLQQIASFPQDEHLYYARNPRSMGEIAEKVKAQICKGNPSAGDRCKCQGVMAFQIQANEEIQRLTQRLDEVLKRLKTVENYVTTK